MTQTDFDTGFHAILELFGHRRLGGYLTQQEIAGAGFLRIDIPGPDGDAVSQFVSPSAVYAITPVTEEIAREIARQAPAPVSRWDLKRLLPEPEPSGYVVDAEDDGNEDLEPDYDDGPEDDDEPF